VFQLSRYGAELGRSFLNVTAACRATATHEKEARPRAHRRLKQQRAAAAHLQRLQHEVARRLPHFLVAVPQPLHRKRQQVVDQGRQGGVRAPHRRLPQLQGLQGDLGVVSRRMVGVGVSHASRLPVHRVGRHAASTVHACGNVHVVAPPLLVGGWVGFWQQHLYLP